MNKNVVCDACGKEFKIKKIKKKVVGQYEGESVTFHYFECPHCKKKYTGFIKTKTIDKLIKEAKRYENKIRQRAKELKEEGLEEELIKDDRQIHGLTQEMLSARRQGAMIQKKLQQMFTLK